MPREPVFARVVAADEKLASRDEALVEISAGQSLWQLEIAEVTGHNLEARGRREVNRLLQAGWRLLYIYTLIYEDDGVWRQRPMAILGRPRVGAREPSSAPPTAEDSAVPRVETRTGTNRNGRPRGKSKVKRITAGDVPL